jgi:hypothetical protein
MVDEEGFDVRRLFEIALRTDGAAEIGEQGAVDAHEVSLTPMAPLRCFRE